ncbi:MAG: undecaprenyldiphospho-muramoylpentapeptide beta-N-acetylglucosaminyltransferase [Dialister sp.]|nr:undecaprenyldiphospho-muramoylpentapeptide beta-N-acetylglucosaminyltransferase [Dialister sp.]
MIRIILSGGGTGGHIYPAVTIAKELERLEDVEILFVGTPRSMESKLVPQEGYAFQELPASGLKRALTLENIKILCRAAASMWKARKILKRFKPDVVIGTGGYVCGPILMAAALFGVPTMIQEQNVIPGVTNKILARVVDRVALGYKEAQSKFPHPEKCVYTGNPIRPEVITAKRAESRKKLHIPSGDFMVLVAGGSRGARAINNAMIDVHRHFKDTSGICLYHVTGSLEYATVKNGLTASDEGLYGKGSRLIEYEYDMPAALAAADLVIYRAGAVGLAELAARGLPSILIPYPYAAEDHQTFNARAFVAAGASKLIEDRFLTGNELIQDIENLAKNPETLENMSISAKKIGKLHAGQDIAQMALELAKEGKNHGS